MRWPERWRVPRPDLRSLLIIGVAILPVVVAIARALVNHRAPLGDDGLISLRADDVLTRNHPWFGTWTSASLSAGVDFNNPSPLHFDLLAIFVKPFGVTVGAILGAGAVNIAAIVIAIRQGFHFGGRRGEALMAVAAVGLSWSLGSEMLVDVWQPHNLVLPFLAFVAATIAVASGRWRSLAWAVGIGSVVMGAHLSFTYVVLVLIAAAIASAWWLDRGVATGREGWRRGVVTAVVVGLLAWLQPLIEQLFGVGTGNLSRVLQARSATDAPLGFGLGARLVAQVVAMPPWWLRPSFTDSIAFSPYGDDGHLHPGGVVGLAPALLLLGLLLGGLTALAVIAGRRGERAVFAMSIVSGVGVAAALFTATVMPAGVIGLAPHQLRWLWPLGVVTMLSIVNGVDRLFLGRWGSPSVRRNLAAAVVAVLVIVNLPAHLSDLGPSAARASNAAVRSLMTQLDSARLPGPTYFDGSTLYFAEPYSGPVLAALTSNGQPIRAGDDAFARQLGEHRRRRNDERYALQVRFGADGAVLGAGESLLAGTVGPDGNPVSVVLIELALSDA